MPSTFTAACVQPNAGNDMAANIVQVTGLVREAARAGASFITTPENTGLMESSSARSIAGARPEASHPMLLALRDLARELGIWLLIGSVGIREEGWERVANRSYLIAPDGGIRQTYDKIHMFDVDLPTGETYRESNAFAPGSKAALVTMPFANLGMTICYDLRFPHLYRQLAQAGAEVITIPSAFTRTTGQAHWHVLQRARAIETGAFIISAAQCGEHPGKRQTYGHSLIVNPWGEVLADGGEDIGFITARIDLAEVAKARAQISAWTRDTAFAPPPRLARDQAAE